MDNSKPEHMKELADVAKKYLEEPVSIPDLETGQSIPSRDKSTTNKARLIEYAPFIKTKWFLLRDKLVIICVLLADLPRDFPGRENSVGPHKPQLLLS